MTNRKGFSLVEVIVSITVVVIVSISSVAVIYTSTKIVDFGYDQYWATSEVNNLKETSYKHFMQNVCKLKKSANKVGENNE